MSRPWAAGWWAADVVRILFLSSVFPHPAAPTRGVYSLQLCTALAARHAVRVLVPRSWVEVVRTGMAGARGQDAHASDTPGEVTVEYVCYYYPPGMVRGARAGLMWAAIRGRVRRLASTFRPDCVVGYWAYPDGATALRAARRLGVPCVIMVGGSDVLIHAGQPAWRRRILPVLQEADAVVAVGEDLAARVVELGVAPARVHVVPRGVDTDVFTPGPRGPARRRLGIPEHERVVLWVGRMVHLKGLDVLLAAADRLRRRRLDFHLYLVGDGPLRRALERACRQRGLDGAVSFVGTLAPRELGDWYRAADYTVLPSRSEGVPNVLRESVACGTPFVASRVGGVATLAADPAHRLVPPDDPDALADVLASVLQGPPPRLAASAPGMSWSDSALALAGVLEPLVAARGARHAATAIPPWTPRQLIRRAMERTLPRRRFLVRGPASCGAVFLTFDDGPDPEHTPRVLDVLEREGVRATFFVVGHMVECHPDIVRRMAQDGHTVGHHSFFHGPPHRTSARQLRDEVVRTRQLLRDLLGTPPDLFRPPSGKLTPAKLLYLWQAGQTVVLWNVDSRDFDAETEDVRAWLRGATFRAGDIVLMHDDRPHAAAVMPDLCRAVRARGLGFRTLRRLSW